MRSQVRYPYQPVVDEAKKQTRQSFHDAGLNAFTTPPITSPPQVTTTASTDENGDVVTLFPAMTELDSTESYGCTG